MKNIKILEYKMLLESHQQCLDELDKGSIDLNYRLSFFNKSTQNKNFNQKISKQKEENQKEENKIFPPSKKKVNAPSKVKKLYKKIAAITHPDKTAGINSKDIIEKYNDLYLKTLNAYEEKDYDKIIAIANDLMIDSDDDLVKEFIEPKIPFLRFKIEKIKEKIGYQWYHIKDEEKDKYFKIILKNYGYLFTEKEVEDVIKRKPPKRKSGKKPQNNIKQRRRINASNKNNSNS